MYLLHLWYVMVLVSCMLLYLCFIDCLFLHLPFCMLFYAHVKRSKVLMRCNKMCLCFYSSQMLFILSSHNIRYIVFDFDINTTIPNYVLIYTCISLSIILLYEFNIILCVLLEVMVVFN